MGRLDLIDLFVRLKLAGHAGKLWRWSEFSRNWCLVGRIEYGGLWSTLISKISGMFCENVWFQLGSCWWRASTRWTLRWGFKNRTLPGRSILAAGQSVSTGLSQHPRQWITVSWWRTVRSIRWNIQQQPPLSITAAIRHRIVLCWIHISIWIDEMMV